MSDFDLFEPDVGEERQDEEEDFDGDMVEDMDEDMDERGGREEEVFDEGGAAAKRRREDENDEEAKEEEYKKVASFQHMGLVGSRKLTDAKDYDKKLIQIALSLDLPEGDRVNILEKIASRLDIRVEYKNPAALILGYIMLINLLRNQDVTKIPKFHEELRKEKFLQLNPIILTTAKGIFNKIVTKYFSNPIYKEPLSGVDARDIIRYFDFLRKLPLNL